MMEAGKGISLWEWGNSLMKKEAESLNNFYTDRGKTAKEFFLKLNSLELTLSEAETIFEQVNAIKANLNLLPSISNKWLNFHFEGNPEKAEKIRREYIEDVALLMELCQSKINLFRRSQSKAPNGLSNFETALRHWYLEENNSEPFITGKYLIEKYGGVKKVYTEICYIRKREKTGNKRQLLTVLNSLSKYPEIQKKIQKDIDLL